MRCYVVVALNTRKHEHAGGIIEIRHDYRFCEQPSSYKRNNLCVGHHALAVDAGQRFARQKRRPGRVWWSAFSRLLDRQNGMAGQRDLTAAFTEAAIQEALENGGVGPR